MRLITVFIFLTVIVNQVFAWDRICTWDAQSLSNASQNLESAISEYESSCSSSYGYQKDDEDACGNFWYIKSNVDTEQYNLDLANISVSYSCGTCNSVNSLVRRLLKENGKL